MKKAEALFHKAKHKLDLLIPTHPLPQQNTHTFSRSLASKMCISNTNSSRMSSAVASNKLERPLNPYAPPFIRRPPVTPTAPPYPHHQYPPPPLHAPVLTLVPHVYPRLVSAPAVNHHPNLIYHDSHQTTIENQETDNTKPQCFDGFQVARTRKWSRGHKRFHKFRACNHHRLFVPPRLRRPAPKLSRPTPAPKLIRSTPAPAPIKMTWREKVSSEDTVDSEKTSVMMRNIPNRYRRDDLMKLLDKYCLEHHMQYDFLYLPMDFKRHNNKGYAFINFTEPNHAKLFQELMNGYQWGWVSLKNTYRSNKICEITWAKIQGKDGLVRHFSHSNFPCYTTKYLPVRLSPPSNGSSSTSTLTTVGRCLRYA